jgi:hypothetical protein
MKTMDLPVKLTEIEMEEKATLLVELMDLRDARQQRFDQVKRDHNAEQARLAYQIKQVQKERREGMEVRPVQVADVPDYHNRKVEQVRQDTGELVGSRAMTDQDRQILVPTGKPA